LSSVQGVFVEYLPTSHAEEEIKSSAPAPHPGKDQDDSKGPAGDREAKNEKGVEMRQAMWKVRRLKRWHECMLSRATLVCRICERKVAVGRFMVCK
jgi:hypothetical protein